MIKKYNEYIKEEINWKRFNLFNKNKYYPEYTGNELDPYGEEDWDDDNLSPILQIAKKQNKIYNRITRLDCCYKNLTNLDGIENLINLKILFCYRNNLTNLNGIENLINLKILDCRNNNLTNLNGIENLINLETLWCYNNQLTNLNGIENLINLKFFNCSFNQLTNLNGIEKLNNLKILFCNDNNFSEDYKKYLINFCEKKNIKIEI